MILLHKHMKSARRASVSSLGLNWADVFTRKTTATKTATTTTTNLNVEARTEISSNELSAKSKSVLRVFNSLSQRTEPLQPDLTTTKGMAWYTCGPTTYAPAHLGHARTYVCLDILRRVLEHQYHHARPIVDGISGHPPPLFVLNITDVDDKILAAAAESQEPPLDFARRFEAEFFRDWDALNCLRPHIVTRVTEHVESSIVPYIQKIFDQGLSYLVEGDGVYFDVRAFEDISKKLQSRYGKLAPSAQATDFYDNHPPTSMLEDRTTTESNATVPEPDERTNSGQKRESRDFCLWKFRKDGEAMYWSSPWGDGRPGWHIECSAMIQSVQDQFRDQYTFQVHAGGVDLKFPHHTNEIAQAEAYHLQQRRIQQANKDTQQNCEWIPHWVHTGHLHIDGMKMSKSLKNFITISDLLIGDKESGFGTGAWSSPADDFRLWCLMSGSYRRAATYTPSGIAEARKIRFEKICKMLDEGEHWIQSSTKGDGGPKTNKAWKQDDVELFRKANQSRNACVTALYSDLDGTMFVKELVLLAEKGIAYMRITGEENPDEPLRHVLQTIRDMLDLVGFSDVTSRAGLSHPYWIPSSSGLDEEGVVGGERALLDEMVQFRSAVRDLALSAVGQNNFSQQREKILRLCDEIREITLPALGVELHDGKHVTCTGGGSDEKDHDSSLNSSSWSYRIPRPKTAIVDKEKKTPNSSTHERLGAIPLQDLFRAGHYRGMFSAYSPDGFPTHNSDGTELSKSLTKKLLKKRHAHEKRLANRAIDSKK